uniref:Zinc finger/thioredoxin putative domain-containing protein n=1 Tax=Chryseobacterium sp. B5 TaxID=2050562 RepID=A0A2G7T8Y6_9FLAO
MSQVTRCPACGTRFKVVADQLRISQGWVRCGVCHEVFDASEDLQPLPTAPVNAAGTSVAGTPVAGGASHNPAEFEDDDIREFRESMWLPTAPSGLPGRGASGPAAPVAPVAPSVPAAPATPAAPAVSTATTAAAARAEPSPSMPPAEVPAPEAPPPSPVTAKDPSASAAEESGSALRGASAGGRDPAASRAAPKSPPAAQAGQAVDGLLGPEPDTAAPVPAPAKDEEGAPFTRPHKPSDKSSDAPAPSVPTGLLRESEPQAQASVPSPEFSRWPDSDGEGSGEAAAALPEAEPGFVRQARRKAFWRRPAVRVALVLGSLLGVGALAGQVMWGQRDALAVQHPSLAPALQTLCAMAGCELQPRRQIGDVVIGSSGFRQLPRSGQYQWSLSLENRSDFPVAMPAVELTLTDAQDKLLLRRVIRLDQFGAPAQIEGHGEWSVTAPVEVQGLEAAVAGYRALVFYP